jgi:hypothetical protein
MMTIPLRLVVTVVAAAVALGDPLRADEQAPTTPRETFRLLGVGDDYFNRLHDGGPLAGAETETLLRVLSRLRVFPPRDLDRWALPAEKLDEAIERPEPSRGSISLLRGRVIAVEPVKPAAEAAERYELFKYYCCRLELDTGQTADVYTENVPAEWQTGAKPDATVGAQGVFLKLGPRTEGRGTLIFAARRLAWYPADLLGRLGMDVGLFDTVKDRQGLTADDSDAFYELFAAVERAEPGQLLRQAEADLPDIREQWRRTGQDGRAYYSVVPLFNEPAKQRGRLVALSGTARRVELIHVDNPDLVARYGIDHYYMVSLFTDDSYDKKWNPQPLTVCVRQLPEGMPTGASPNYGETVRVAGFFFKSWAYRVERVKDSAGKLNPATQIQYSPLLIARSLVWHPAPKPSESTTTNVVIGVLFIGFMLIIWALAWQNRRQARQWEKQAVGESPHLDAGIDLAAADRRDDDHPDFSRLTELDQENP